MTVSDVDTKRETGATVRGSAAPPWTLLVCLVFAMAYSMLSLRRFYSYNTTSWDNAIFEQAIAGYAHLQRPIVNIKGPGFDILGDHFSPIIMLVAPFYRLFPRAETLLLAQCVLVAASIYPILRIATRYAGEAAGTAIGISYGLSFGIQTAVYTDFHEVAFGAPLLAFAGAAYVERRWTQVVAWSAPLVLVKEDLGLTVAVIGVLLALAGARKRGILLAVGGLAMCVITVLVLIPAVNPTGQYPYRQEVGGGGFSPSIIAGTLVDGSITKIVTILITFGVTGFLALRSPWCLVVVPTLAERFLGANTAYWSTYFHYSLLPMTIVFVAMVDAIRRAPSREPPWWRAYVQHAPAAALAAALALCMQFPLWTLTQPETYERSDKAAAGAAAIAMIPAGATVETDTGLALHLVAGHQVFWFGNMGDVIPDYVLLDANSGHDVEIAQFAEEQFPGTRYVQIFDEGGYLLAKRSE